jgi:hypothetical protein
MYQSTLVSTTAGSTSMQGRWEFRQTQQGRASRICRRRDRHYISTGMATTNASFRSVIDKRLEVMVINSRSQAYDSSFYNNIGVRKTLDDIGISGVISTAIHCRKLAFLNGRSAS